MKLIKLTFDIPITIARKLMNIAKTQDITLTAALCQSISTLSYLLTKREQGCKILIKTGDTITELSFL